MDDVERGVSFATSLVYWFLVAVALVFGVLALVQVNKWRSRRDVDLRVTDRTVRLETRDVRARRGTVKRLYAVADLRLERTDTREVVRLTDELDVDKDQLVTLAFLENWERGAPMRAGWQDGQLDLHAPPPWLPAAGFAIAMLLFGTFAWMAKPFAEGKSGAGAGWKFAVLALFPIGAAAFGIGTNALNDRKERALQRVAVEGRGKSMALDELLQELAGAGVTAGEDVRKFINRDRVSYCEYSWEGKTLRSVSLWCQPPEGEACPGRVNPANPRDVKWGEAP